MSKRPFTFIRVITQIMTFSLNLGTYNKDLKTRYFPRKIFLKGIRISYKFFFFKLFRKTLCSNLIKNSFLLFIISVLMMRFKEEKYGKLCQSKSEINTALPEKAIWEVYFKYTSLYFRSLKSN